MFANEKRAVVLGETGILIGPCPFCAGGTRIVRVALHGDMRDWYRPQCLVCGATVDNRWTSVEEAVAFWHSFVAWR